MNGEVGDRGHLLEGPLDIKRARQGWSKDSCSLIMDVKDNCGSAMDKNA